MDNKKTLSAAAILFILSVIVLVGVVIIVTSNNSSIQTNTNNQSKKDSTENKKDEVEDLLKDLYSWKKTNGVEFEVFECISDTERNVLKLTGNQLKVENLTFEQMDGAKLSDRLEDNGWTEEICNSAGGATGNLYVMVKNNKYIRVLEEYDMDKQIWSVTVNYQL